MDTDARRVQTLRRASPFADGPLPALRYFGFRLAAWLAERLPRPIADRVASLGGRIWFALSKRKREVVRRNMTRVLPAGADLDGVVRRAFDSYARYWLETFRVSSYSKEELVSMVRSDSIHVLKEALAEGRGAVVATAHFGFYDVGVAWLGALEIPMATVGEVLRPRALFEWFAASRLRRGMEVIPASPRDAARARQIEALGEGKGLALLADRDLGRRGVWVNLFGEKTTLPAGPSLLVVRTRIPLLFGAIYAAGDGFRVDFEEVPYTLTGDERRDVQSLAQLIAGRVERTVWLAPEQWHLFSTNWPSDETDLPPRGGLQADRQT